MILAYSFAISLLGYNVDCDYCGTTHPEQRKVIEVYYDFWTVELNIITANDELIERI